MAKTANLPSWKAIGAAKSLGAILEACFEHMQQHSKPTTPKAVAAEAKWGFKRELGLAFARATPVVVNAQLEEIRRLTIKQLFTMEIYRRGNGQNVPKEEATQIFNAAFDSAVKELEPAGWKIVSKKGWSFFQAPDYVGGSGQPSPSSVPSFLKGIS